MSRLPQQGPVHRPTLHWHAPPTAYRSEDKGVYFLTRDSKKLQLRRWYYLRQHPDGGAVRTLATFPKKWTGYERYGLTLGPTGDIGIAAWRVGHSGARFLRFTLDKANRLTISGYSKRKYEVVADPVLDFDAFLFSRRPFAHDRTTAKFISFD